MMRNEPGLRTLSRRRFLAGSGALAGLAGLAACAGAWFQRDATEAAKGVIVDQLGFTPVAPKHCLHPGTRPLEFRVLRADTGRMVLRSRLSPLRGDLGDYLVEFDHAGKDRLPEDLRAQVKPLWELNEQSDENMSGRLFVPE